VQPKLALLQVAELRLAIMVAADDFAVVNASAEQIFGYTAAEMVEYYEPPLWYVSAPASPSWGGRRRRPFRYSSCEARSTAKFQSSKGE
jgi:hypothetical protein